MFAMIVAVALQSTSWTAFDEADAHLNAAYRAVRAHLTASDRQALRSAQRAWIEQRNRSCGREARNDCAARMSLERTEYLEERLRRAPAYGETNDDRLTDIAAALQGACQSPSQDADGVICRRRDEAYTELRRRGYPD